MNTVRPPIESEFATTEDAAAYDRWFREQVQDAIDDPCPAIPHHQVMAEMRVLIASKRKNSKANNPSRRQNKYRFRKL